MIELKKILIFVLVLALASTMTLIIINMKKKSELFQYAILNVLPDGNIMYYARGKPVQPYLLECNSNPEMKKWCNFLKARQGTYGYFYPKDAGCACGLR